MIHFKRNFDQIRVLSTIAVLVIHVSSIYLKKEPSLDNFDWWIGAVCFSFVRWCVPCFVMLSGALLISQKHAFDKETSLKHFYKRRFHRIGSSIFFWSVFYSAFSYARHGQGSRVLESITLGQPYFHMWYLYMIAMLYIFVPFISAAYYKLSSESLFLLSTLIIFICFADSAIKGLYYTSESQSTFLLSFVPYIGYFVLGKLISDSFLRSISLKKALSGTLLAGVIMVSISAFSLYVSHPSWMTSLYDYTSPLIVIQSVLVFWILLQVNLLKHVSDRSFRQLGELSLGIYLIHPFWIYLFRKLIGRNDELGALLNINLEVFLILGLSLVTALSLSKLPLTKKIV